VSEPLWRTFQSFVHIISIDLCWLRWDSTYHSRYIAATDNRRPWREVTLPSLLFPTAKSVRLSGCTTSCLVASVLGSASIPGPQLRSLELEDLKQWAEIHPTPPSFTHLRDLSAYLDANRSNLRIRRTTTGTFTALMGCHSNLTSLRITTAGLKHVYPQESGDNRVYALWATLLHSIRSTLCMFSFEQSQGHRNSSAPPPPQYQVHRPRSGLRPMDRFFVQHILPVLLKTPWPRMQHTEIRGVGRSVHIEHANPPIPTGEDVTFRPDITYEDASSNHPGHAGISVTRVAFSEHAQMRLHWVLGDGVELVIEERPLREYEEVEMRIRGSRHRMNSKVAREIDWGSARILVLLKCLTPRI
jgi:hypothetical protein